LQNITFDILRKEKSTLPLWMPFFIALGAIFCFWLKKTPNNITITFAVFLVLINLVAFLKFKNSLFLIFIFLSLGFATAQIKTALVKTKPISKPVCIKNISGMVSDITDSISYKKVAVLQQNGKIIKITARTKVDPNLQVGDLVEFSACLNPPSGPLAPHGYDFAKFASFDGIVATGFATSAIKIIQAKHKSNLILKLRHKIYQNLQNNMQKDTAEIAAALIIGKKDGIKKETLDIFRQSGTSHLLAISGLHLSLVCAIILYTVRSLLCTSEYIALKFDTKKVAAICAIAFGFFYLQIAGCPVSAQRAFIMTAIVLLAVLIDKKTCIMRSIALAATLIIIVSPENVLKPGFQMSFFAVLGLCSWLSRLLNKQSSDAGIIKKSILYITTTIYGSFLATIATLPFCVYHFYYFSVAGIFANLIAIPIVTFLIMPTIVVTIFLMPFGGFFTTYKILQYCIKLLVYLNAILQNIGGFLIHGFSGDALLIIAFGMLMLILLKTKIKYFGSIPILIGVYCAYLYVPPDIFISQNQIAINNKKNLYFLNTKKEPKNFVARTWIAHCGIKSQNPANIPEGLEHVNNNLYVYQKSGFKIAFKSDNSDIDCAKYDLIFAYKTYKNYSCNNVFNKIQLQKSGPVFIWLKKSKMISSIL
jgi:competence protein ComEC